ncbi:LOW QUALITY PROTEIN: dynein light chain Tctex-type protein 2B [Tachysurus fulvidraco]|uniref:LOW QUALITY PROTEIN: dynein light chain Tctex-type protein 2B n=1 Tax=Tachysurus fulvidraco TaxID=1234273 RepID=UPI001FEF951B|nr:LOW QUALITY PROTEIN: dynein light chain Tctex-type protein 2B [Tachysurus fulvidraco]
MMHVYYTLSYNVVWECSLMVSNGETFKPAASKKKGGISKQTAKKETPSLSTRPQQAEDVVKEHLMLHQPVLDQRFPSSLVHLLMKHLVDERLTAMEYSPACSAVATKLSTSIKDAAKSLSSGRYKLISHVAIGQLCNSAISCSSHSIWSADTDTFTEYLFKNQHLFALCVLFVVYQE